MIPVQQQAAHLLEGMVLEGGWKVIKKLNRLPGGTGGMYSACYEVENGDRKGFLKAFDYSSIEKVTTNSTDELRNILNAFTLEKDILEACTNANCRNVIKLLGTGGVVVDKAIKYPKVEYLILEYAQAGDLRTALNKSNLTLTWQLRSLHQLANGLRQIHDLEIAHQDIKPSNVVLSTDKGIAKITDFGSAIQLNRTATPLPFHLSKDISGTWEYAPPELLYGSIDENATIRRIGCDLYLLGSIIVFYFTKTSMTALLRSNLSDALCWTHMGTRGRYDEIKPYLQLAFEKSLEDFGNIIKEGDLRDSLVLIVSYLCNPDPLRRGHVKTIKETGSNYNLHRFVTMFDLLARRYELKNK